MRLQSSERDILFLTFRAIFSPINKLSLFKLKDKLGKLNSIFVKLNTDYISVYMNINLTFDTKKLTNQPLLNIAGKMTRF